MGIQDDLGPPGQEAVELLVRGTVQGVGFRPFVYRLAKRFGLRGSVANSASGVVIKAVATKEIIRTFIKALMEEAPPLSKITGLERRLLRDREKGEGFVILESAKAGGMEIFVPPDVATCQNCLSEMNDPSDRRYGYQFINCTDCGPRYSIIESMPYDRPMTSMKAFTMCGQCLEEYRNPDERRFHAEPNACPRCGPRLSWCARNGCEIETDDPIREAVFALKRGAIVAIKGMGGFHLAVDASSFEAVSVLRKRKARGLKPLAVMVSGLEDARRICMINDVEADALSSPERPIVLMQKRGGTMLAENIAPGVRDIGLMLPYTPLHHLMFVCSEAPPAIVMTSGNLTNEPICRENGEALERLSRIADFFLLHDRRIVNRIDDSVVRIIGGRPRMVRRSRGYAPMPIGLLARFPELIATGGLLKNTFCISRGGGAILSQHIGDLDNPDTFRFFEEGIRHMKAMFEVTPEAAACDMHPDYASTRYAKGLRLPVYHVQHHHAHAAAVMAEHGLSGPCLAVIMDGTGLGQDGTVWGGEIMLVRPTCFKRLGRLGHLMLPGGDAAARQPWRMAMSAVFSAFGAAGLDAALPDSLASIPYKKREIIAGMLKAGFNTPVSSSCGRLFDAVSALVGICDTAEYEGHAAMAFEALSCEVAGAKKHCVYPVDILEQDGVLVLDHSNMIKSVLKDIGAGVPAAEIGASFHLWLIKALCIILRMLSLKTGVKSVVLGGGCMQNRILLDGLLCGLWEAGLTPYAGEMVPANDGGISLGQIVIGGARHVSGHTYGDC